MTSFLPLSIEELFAIADVWRLELLVIRIVASTFLFFLPLWCLILIVQRVSLTVETFDIKIHGISRRSRFLRGCLIIVAEVL